MKPLIHVSKHVHSLWIFNLENFILLRWNQNNICFKLGISEVSSRNAKITYKYTSWQMDCQVIRSYEIQELPFINLRHEYLHDLMNLSRLAINVKDIHKSNVIFKASVMTPTQVSLWATEPTASINHPSTLPDSSINAHITLISSKQCVFSCCYSKIFLLINTLLILLRWTEHPS